MVAPLNNLREETEVTSEASATAVDRPATQGADLVARLYREEVTALVRLARIFTEDRNAAEDLVQEGFIRFQRSAHQLRDPDKAAAYLRSVVLNLARDHNRRGLMSLRHQETALEREPASVEAVVIAGENEREIIEALNTLPNRQRDCLVLRFYLDLSERETAESMGISPNSVKTHCRRGLAALEQRLEDKQ